LGIKLDGGKLGVAKIMIRKAGGYRGCRDPASSWEG